MNNDINILKEYYKSANKIVFFGGAGVSTASNIPDFRSEKGLYQVHSEYGVSYEVILSHTYYKYHPDIFFDFYKKHMIYKDALPNKAHLTLTKIQEEKNLIIIAQNIDGLHQKANNKNVLELHGSIHRNYCEKCGASYSLNAVINSINIIPHCHCGGTIKPDVVLYEESLNQDILEKSINAISSADLIIVAGTSLNVYPAASLIRYKNPSSKLVIINYQSTPQDEYADLIIHEDIGKTLEEMIK